MTCSTWMSYSTSLQNRPLILPVNRLQPAPKPSSHDWHLAEKGDPHSAPETFDPSHHFVHAILQWRGKSQIRQLQNDCGHRLQRETSEDHNLLNSDKQFVNLITSKPHINHKELTKTTFIQLITSHSVRLVITKAIHSEKFLDKQLTFKTVNKDQGDNELEHHPGKEQDEVLNKVRFTNTKAVRVSDVNHLHRELNQDWSCFLGSNQTFQRPHPSNIQLSDNRSWPKVHLSNSRTTISLSQF